MAKRVVWKYNDLVNLKLRDDLYTIGQMLYPALMRFYDIHNDNGQWHDIDLNQVKPLFRVFVGQVVMQRLVENKIKDKTVIASHQPCERYWIKPYNIMDHYYPGKQGDFVFLGGKLIDVDTDINRDTVNAPVVKENLQLPQDRQLIEEYELAIMWVANDLGDRGRNS